MGHKDVNRSHIFFIWIIWDKSVLAVTPKLRLIRIDSNRFNLNCVFLRFFEYSVQLKLKKLKFIFIWIVICLGKYSWKFTWIFLSRFMNIHCEYLRIFGSIRVKFDKMFAKLEYFQFQFRPLDVPPLFFITKGMGIVWVLSNGQIFYYYWIITKSSRMCDVQAFSTNAFSKMQFSSNCDFWLELI
jgi:hypothetical protein